MQPGRVPATLLSPAARRDVRANGEVLELWCQNTDWGRVIKLLHEDLRYAAVRHGMVPGVAMSIPGDLFKILGTFYGPVGGLCACPPTRSTPSKNQFFGIKLYVIVRGVFADRKSTRLNSSHRT